MLANKITNAPKIDEWLPSTHRKIVQFHPSYSYEDFVQGIKPAKDAKGEVDYKLQPGIFQNLCKLTAPPTETGATPESMLECAIFVLVKEKGRLSYAEIHKRTMKGHQQHDYGPLYSTTSPNAQKNQRWVLNRDQRENINKFLQFC